MISDEELRNYINKNGAIRKRILYHIGCPMCGSELYEQNRDERTGGTFISIRCSNKECNYYNYKQIPVKFEGTITGEIPNVM